MNHEPHRKRLVPIAICLLFSAIAIGCTWGFYEAFALHDEEQIAAGLRNFPFLLFIIVGAVASWIVKI
jgi:hypothetical protein